MKAIAKRLRRLEDQFRPADGKPRERFRIVLQPAGLRTPDLAHSTVPKDSVAERHRSRDRGAGTSSNGQVGCQRSDRGRAARESTYR